VSLSYTNIHWGTRPDRETELTVPAGNASPIGEMKACSYVTIKGGEPNIYRHEFERFHDPDEHRERGPYLLKQNEQGEFILGGCPASTIAIGYAIDFELVGGERVLCSQAYLVTDKEGKHVWLAGDNLGYDLERRLEGPVVTERGIEA